ncbi:MAG: hypothetical protein HEQ13_02205 [Dolichospermum sp. DEX189]|nr:hypothetical protein [Dolichospermum sp. DEX189]
MSLGQGNREQGTGNRTRVLSDFTFLHIPLNFSVHLLNCFEAEPLWWHSQSETGNERFCL